MITSNQIDKGLSTVVKGANIVKGLSRLAKRNSIMKMADPGMYQYPIFMSESIETPIAMAIAKAYQQTYAASVVTAYSLNPVMNMKNYKEVTDFVQKFHSNSGIPSNFTAAGNTVGINASESFTIDIADATIVNDIPECVTEALSIRAWDRIEDQVTMESLNDMYRPYDRTQRIMGEKIQTLKKANEAISDTVKKIYNFADDANSVYNDPNSKSNVPINGGRRVTTKTNTHHQFDPYGIKTDTTISETKTEDVKPAINRNFNNGVVRNDKLEALEPTMINVQIVCHSEKTGQFMQNLTLGVKAMVRTINTNLMIASMVEACKSSNRIFSFLKWTKGEKKTLDFVLGISSAKKKALEKNAKMEVRVLRQSQKRKKNNMIGKFLNNEVLPTLSIVLTTYEVLKIKEICGVDLNLLEQAVKLMNKYYLLSIAIYDTEQNTLKVLFDCDDDWSYVSVATMKSMVNKTNDILNQNEILKLFGRR